MIREFGNEERFLFSCKAHPTGLQVASFTGSEGISRPFEFQIRLVSKSSEIGFDELVNKPAVLTIRGREQDRHVQGIVISFEVVRIYERHTVYQVELAPPHARLDLRRSMRIFQRTTTRLIVNWLLQKEGGITPLEWRLSASYGVRDFCVQYRETELGFVQRLLEEEGIAYHFEHTDSELRTVFCDSASARKAIGGEPELIYKEDRSMVTDQEAVHELSFCQQLRSGAIELRDYNFKKPSTRVSGRARGKETALEHYDYPGEFVDAELGDRLARIRLQELEQEHRIGRGASDCNRLLPGRTFTLGGKVRRHPRPELNQDYLILLVRHQGSQPQVLGEEGDGEGISYGNDFTVIPAKVEYRPPRVTCRPEVIGTQTATVVGPPGEEIYTDSYGRVQVRFHWDRAAVGSCWIRVSQGWAGAGYGQIFIPRVGQEVLVTFIEGDPDRPLITGRVYNGEQTVPYELPANKTRSAIKTSSSPGGGGFNEIRFEDKAGSEELYIHAQRDQTHLIENDQRSTVGNDRTERVTRDETIWINGMRYLRVAKSSIHRARRIFLKAEQRIKIMVGASVINFTPSSIKRSSKEVTTESEGTITIKGGVVKIN